MALSTFQHKVYGAQSAVHYYTVAKLQPIKLYFSNVAGNTLPIRTPASQIYYFPTKCLVTVRSAQGWSWWESHGSGIHAIREPRGVVV